MGKLIAVSGPPSSGKTTVAVKLAQEICAGDAQTIYFSPDQLIPSMGLLFPTQKKEDVHTIGTVLDKMPLTMSDILSVMQTTKDADDLGYLGYKPGDHPGAYAALTEQRVLELLALLKANSDYLIVDCTRDRDELVSRIVRDYADRIVYVCNPDLRSLLYYGTEPMRPDGIRLLNILDNDVLLPVQEAKTYFGRIQHTVAYSRAIKEQLLEGELTKPLKDVQFCASIAKLAVQLRDGADAKEEKKE